MFSEEQLDSLMATEASPRYVISNEPQKIIRGHEDRVAKSVRRTAQVTRKVVNSSEALFTLATMSALPNPWTPVIHASYEGERLLDAVSKDLPEFEEYFPTNACNPYIELLKRAVKAHPDIIYARQEMEQAQGLEVHALFARVDGFVQTLRNAARSKPFIAELDARRRQCQKNDASAKKYINEIFQYRASKNLAVRLDIVCGSEDPERRGITSSVNVGQARKELDRFIRHVREKFPLTGYMGTFEYGALTGYHFHLLLFFDGHKQWNGPALGFLLGEVWKNEITEGRGRYFNCNVVKYAENGIGMICHYDMAKREVLQKKVVSYLTKSDFWLKFQGTRKTFFRGVMPSEQEKGATMLAVGRPRKLPELPHDMASERAIEPNRELTLTADIAATSHFAG